MDIRYSWSYSCLLPRFVLDVVVLDVVVICVPEAGESGARLASPLLTFCCLVYVIQSESSRYYPCKEVNRPSQHVISHPQDRIAEYAIKYVRG